MAQKKASEVAGWIQNPSDASLVLLYGPDRGLVSEHATGFARTLGLDMDDPFSVIRLDASDIEQQPGRLVDEVSTVPMFSSRRLVWVRNAGAQKNLAEDVKAICATPSKDAVVLIEAGELKRGSALRATVEAGPRGMALPCYPDEARDIDRLIDEELARGGRRIEPEARQRLRGQLGGDRLATRGEIEKLVLYVGDGKEIRLADVEALVGDVSALSADDAVDALLSGDIEGFDALFDRQAQAGQIFPLLSAAQRQLQSLHRMRASMERSGQNAAATVAQTRPPIFFARRRAVEQALGRWPAASLARAMERLRACVLLTRRRPELATAAARRELLALALEGARLRSRTGNA